MRTDEIRKKFRESERALQQRADTFEKEAHQLHLDKRQLQQQLRDAQRSADSATRDSLRYHEETQRIRGLLEKSTKSIKKESEARRILQEEITSLKYKIEDLEAGSDRARARAPPPQPSPSEPLPQETPEPLVIVDDSQRERAEKLSKELVQLQSQLRNAQRDESDKSRQIEQLSADAQTQKASLRRLEEQLEQSRGDSKKDSEARKKAEEDLIKLSSQIQRLQEDKSMMSRELEVHRSEVETRQREFIRLTEEHQRLKTEVQFLKRNVDTVSKEASSSALHQLNEQRLTDELKQAREQKQQLQDSVDKMANEAKLWEAEKQRLQKAVEDEKVSSAGTLKRLNETIDTAAKDLASHRSVQDMNAKLMKELTEAGNNLRKALDDKRFQESQVASLKKEMETLKAAAKTQADALAQAEAQLKAAALQTPAAAPAITVTPTGPRPEDVAAIAAHQKEVAELKQKVSELQVQLSKETKAKEEGMMLLKRLQKAKAGGAAQPAASPEASPPTSAPASPDVSALRRELEDLSKEKTRADDLAKKLEFASKEKDDLVKKLDEERKANAVALAAASALASPTVTIVPPPTAQQPDQIELLNAEKAKVFKLEEANAILQKQAAEWRSKFQLVRTISTDGRKRPTLVRDGSSGHEAKAKPAPHTPPDARTLKVIKIQAVFRGCLARLNFKDIKYRRNVATEIFETERVYVTTLDALTRTCVGPLRHMVTLGEPIISSDDISFVFSNIELLYQGNKRLLDLLESRLKKWHFEQVLGDVFLTAMKEDFLKPHVPFIQNFSKSSEARTRLMTSVPMFSTFVKLCRIMPGIEGKSLDDLLIAPVQRLPRYKLLLTDLQKRTPRSHPDYVNVTRAIGEIDNFTSFINENNRRVDELNNLSSRLSGLEQLEENPDRRLIFEGKLSLVIGKDQKRRYVLLFNDCLVFAKDGRRKRLSLGKDPNSNQLKVVASVKLTGKTTAETIPVFDGKRASLRVFASSLYFR